MKRFISLLLASIMVLSLTACGDSKKEETKEVVTLTIGHSQTEADPYHKGVAKFCELVEERTNGAVKFDLYPNSQLGSENDMFANVSQGTMDAALVTNPACQTKVPELGVLDFPYQFSSAEEAYAILDGEFGAELGALFESQANMHLLGYMENGFRNLTTTMEVRYPSDIKGVKIRTMDSRVHKTAFENAGAIVTIVAGNELYTSLQQGVVNGQENPLKSIYDQKYYEVTPYILCSAHFYTPANLLINLDVWNSFDADTQAIITECAKEAVDYQRQCCAERADEVRKLMEENGAIITDMTDDMRTAWAEAMAPTYSDPDLVATYGTWLEKLNAAREKLA